MTWSILFEMSHFFYSDEHFIILTPKMPNSINRSNIWGALAFCQLGILSSWHFINLELHQLGICPLGICPLGICPLGILSPWHFVPLALCPLGILSPWHFVPLAFCPLGILFPWHFVQLAFCILGISSTCPKNIFQFELMR
jgi:hypothetical protein